MSAVSMNEAAKKTAQLENAKEARPPGGAPQEEHLPRKIFVCSPYRPTSQDEKCRKDELEANIRRAKMACRILSTPGFLPLAPHLYFTQFLKDEEKQERNTGIQLGMQWLEEADELWVFGRPCSRTCARRQAPFPARRADRKSTRLNSSHASKSRMPSSA